MKTNSSWIGAKIPCWPTWGLQLRNRTSIWGRGRGRGRLCTRVGCLSRIFGCWWTCDACCVWATTILVKIHRSNWLLSCRLGSIFWCDCGLRSDPSSRWRLGWRRRLLRSRWGCWRCSLSTRWGEVGGPEGFIWSRLVVGTSRVFGRSPCILGILWWVHVVRRLWNFWGSFRLDRNEGLCIKTDWPEVLGEVGFYCFHVLQEGQTSRVFGGVVGGVILDSFVGELEFLGH